MSAEKNSKKNGIEKLRILLDEESLKKLNPEDEKYLIALKKRLDESSSSKIVIKKIVETSQTEEYSLKPKIVIHTRKQEIKPIPKIVVEEKPRQQEPEPIFEEVTEGKKIDDDLIEIKKIEIKHPEFLEVKPKTAKKEEKIKTIEDTKNEKESESLEHEINKEEIEELTEWEPVVDKKEQIIEKESSEPKEETFIEIEDKQVETENVCPKCGNKTKKYINFCQSCGFKLNQNFEEEKQNPDEEESVPCFIPVEKPEEDKEDIDWKQEGAQHSLIESETKEIISVESNIKEKPVETDLEKEKKKESFKEIESIDEKTAVLLYDNGYTSIDSLKNSTIKDIKKIKGIKNKKAKNIIFEIESRFKETESDKSLAEEDGTMCFEEDVETTQSEIKEEQVQELDENIILDEKKIIVFNKIKSIDEKTAILLYDHGFTSIDALNISSVKDIAKIPGIKKRKAKQIKKEVDEKTNEIFVYKPIETEETAQGEITEEQVQELDENKISDEEKTIVFNKIKSIDKETAIILYDNGYNTIDTLKNTTMEELVKIPGIKKRKAKRIISEIEEKILESSELKPITVDETAQGELTEEQINDEKMVFEEEKDDKYKVEFHSKKTKWAPVEEDQDFKEENLKESEEKSFEEEYAQVNKDIEKIEKFAEIKSIDEKTAVLLYDNGYTTIDSLKNSTIKDIKKIKGIKNKKAKNIITEIENKFKEAEPKKPIAEEYDAEYFEEEFDEDLKKVDEKIKKFKEPKRKKDEEDNDFFQEEIEDVPEIKPDEKDESVFREIQSIDDKIRALLIENDIDTIEKLNDTPIKELTKIKGIRKKIAKQIKKEAELNIKINSNENEESYENIEENPYIKDEDDQIEEEWESIDSKKTSKKQRTIYGFMYNEYTLYEKEITTKSGSKRMVRFFSKGEPEDAKPIDIPDGYEVDENKSGVPYLRKIKD
jgi:Holliday junction resolvasome RuvABC DNA-binding subunit